jgi:hypothetical protein
MNCVQGDADVPLSELEGEDESPDHNYRLVCIIMHQGISPNCGEYLYPLEQGNGDSCYRVQIKNSHSTSSQPITLQM